MSKRDFVIETVIRYWVFQEEKRFHRTMSELDKSHSKTISQPQREKRNAAA